MNRPLLFLAMLVVPTIIPLPAFAQQERPGFATGTDVFRRLLYDQSQQNLRALGGPEQIEDPSRTILVVLGDTTNLDLMDHLHHGWLVNFVNQGGAVLVASDLPTDGAVEKAFGVRISGEFVEAPQGFPSAYRGYVQCPYVLPGPGTDPSLFKETRLDGQSGPQALVATNKPSYLIATKATTLKRPTDGRIALPLAHFPTDCVAPTKLPIRGMHYDFAIGGTLGKGKALIVADHSIFINSMMLGDNGNIDFTIQAATWLRDGPNGPRDQILFYEEDGHMETRFDIPLKEVPLPIPPNAGEYLWDVVKKMNENGTLRKIEEENVLDRGLYYALERAADKQDFWPELTGSEKLARLIFLGSSLLLGGYAFVKLGIFRHRFATSPSLATLLAKQPKPLPALRQRQQALLQSGNLWEAARDLARQFFVSAGISLTGAPEVEIRGGWWKRWRTRTRILRLWRLAVEARPQRVSRSRFERLVAQLRELQAALADGRVRWKGTAT
jgi:hypothetical protein